ncbi:hypothetical protein STEG23_001349 [Scotinomys teguina]
MDEKEERGKEEKTKEEKEEEKEPAFREESTRCAFVHIAAVPRGPEALDPLELELQVDVSHLMWVLGTELRSFERAGCTLSPAFLSHLM